jgi:hypothetical protein
VATNVELAKKSLGKLTGPRAVPGKASHKLLLLLRLVDMADTGGLTGRTFTRTANLVLHSKEYRALVSGALADPVGPTNPVVLSAHSGILAGIHVPCRRQAEYSANQYCFRHATCCVDKLIYDWERNKQESSEDPTRPKEGSKRSIRIHDRRII